MLTAKREQPTQDEPAPAYLSSNCEREHALRDPRGCPTRKVMVAKRFFFSNFSKRHTGTLTFYMLILTLFSDLALLFSYRISHSYARSSFSRLQREVSLNFHFCPFFIISALVLESLFRHLYTGKPKLWTHMKITFFFDIFAFFR